MSPGNQILALTATSARANRATIKTGKRVVRKKPKVKSHFELPRKDTNVFPQ